MNSAEAPFPAEVMGLKSRARALWLDSPGLAVLLSERLGDDPALSALVVELVDDGGSHLRAALPHLVLECLGSPVPEEAALGAVSTGLAYELLHQGVLAHDDVMDGMKARRGRSTMWNAAGVPMAVAVGDLAMSLAWLALRGQDGPRLLLDDIAARFASTSQHIHQGQAAELILRTRLELPTVPWCERTTALKTGAVFGAAFEAGAILADVSPAGREVAFALGREFGAIFQIVDDIEDGPDSATDTASPDLWEGKPSWLVAVAVAKADEPTRRWVAEHLYRPTAEKTTHDVAAVARMIDGAGAFDRLRGFFGTRRIELLERADAFNSDLGDLVATLVTWLDHRLERRADGRGDALGSADGTT